MYMQYPCILMHYMYSIGCQSMKKKSCSEGISTCSTENSWTDDAWGVRPPPQVVPPRNASGAPGPSQPSGLLARTRVGTQTYHG